MLHRRFSVIVLILLVAAGCDDAVGPPQALSGPAALVQVGGYPEESETHRFLAVGLESAQVAWSEYVMFRIVGTALSPDGEVVYAIGTGEDGWRESQIVAMDARDLSVIWREYLAGSEGYLRSRFDGMAIRSTTEFEVSPDGRFLFVSNAEREGERGVAVLDSDSREAVGFVGPFPGNGMRLEVVSAGSFRPGGALIVSPGHPSGSPNVGSTLVIVDPLTLDRVESVDIAEHLDGDLDGIAEITATPDGGHLYLRSSSGLLLKYDLAAGQVVRRTRSPAPTSSCQRCLTLSPDAERVYLPHTWTHEAPSPGIIQVFDSNLQELPAIDLSGVRVEQYGNPDRYNPPALNHVATADDGTLIVGTGAMLAQLWGFQSGAIYFIDPASHEIVDSVQLEGELAVRKVMIP